MISTFNLAKLHSLLQDFYILTHIRITVFDETFNELVSYPDQLAPSCLVIRNDPSADASCRSCDKRACEIARQRHAPYTYVCHAGLTESITPLYMGNIIIGYLLFGHVFSYPSYEEGWKVIQSKCSDYQIDMVELKKALWKSPIISEEFILSAAHILKAVASFLCLERMAVLRRKELPVEIDEYITSHFTDNINVQTICSQFNIGKTRLYEIATANYGTGIAEHIRKMRIEKARQMLINEPKTSISEIAAQCGFDDYNYFITVFRKITGISPRRYRKATHAGTESNIEE